jgi:methionyl-tRNA synthetase
MAKAEHPPVARRRIDVVFSPPTPTGDLHLGQLAGPVLAADVCARAQRMLGCDVAFASSTDDNRTAVPASARRLGVPAEDLARGAFADLAGTLELAGVWLDQFERPDAPYSAYVQDFFTRLWRHGAFDRRELDLPYDAAAGEHPVEAAVVGRCPHCLASASAGACQGCCRYNLPGALLPVPDTTSALPRRPAWVWGLDLERHRAMLTQWYQASDLRPRPDLSRLVVSTLREPLPFVPVTYPGDWGVPVSWDGPDAAPQVLSAGPESYAGRQYWLERARAGRRPGCDELVQFVGIDRGFASAFVHVTLALLAARIGLPIQLPRTRTITNQHYLVDGRKLGSRGSQGASARRYVEQVGRDRARFVLARTSPELQPTEFSEPIATLTMATEFDRPLAQIGQALNDAVRGRAVDARPSPWWATAIEGSRRRFALAYHLDTFSIRAAAEALAKHLDLLALRCGQIRLDDAADVSGALLFLWTLRSFAWPLTPDLAEQVSKAFGAASTLGASPSFVEASAPPSGSFRGLDV